jgi:hypothetical protein
MDSRPRCTHCGRPKRRGPTPTEEYVCSVCGRDRRGGELRAWSREFDDRVAWLFITHPMQWVHITEELGCTSEDAADSVRLMRRAGFNIEGDPHKGRRLVGWTRWPQAE